MRGLVCREIWRRDEMSPRRQVAEPLERVLAADEALTAARLLHRQKLIAKVARVVAKQNDAPFLRVHPPVAQRRKRNADFERPAMIVDVRGRLPEEIRRRILAAAV